MPGVTLNLARRSLEPEMMDDPNLEARLHEGALRGLARLNAVSGIRGQVWRALAPMLWGGAREVVDVAAGSGDLIAFLARRSGEGVRFTATDISERACAAVRDRAASGGLPVRALRMDALREGVPACDVAMCHLFVHHLGEGEIVTLLRSMWESARVGVVITDLRRTRLGYASVWLASRAVTRSPVVRRDALLSVRAALSEEELRGHAERAGMRGAEVRRVWPAQMALTWRAGR